MNKWQVNINIWQDDIKIWQVNIIIWRQWWQKNVTINILMIIVIFFWQVDIMTYRHILLANQHKNLKSKHNYLISGDLKKSTISANFWQITTFFHMNIYSYEDVQMKICGFFFRQLNIMTNRYIKLANQHKIWQVTVIIWQVVAEICQHNIWKISLS